MVYFFLLLAVLMFGCMNSVFALGLFFYSKIFILTGLMSHLTYIESTFLTVPFTAFFVYVLIKDEK